MKIVIHGDGSCLGTPGAGGWAVLIHRFPQDAPESRILITGGADGTTNNRMELEAMRHALLWVRDNAREGDEVTFRFDSEYVLKGAFERLGKWKGNGWRTGANAPVANLDLWKLLDVDLSDARASGAVLRPEWVRGHTGDPDNEAVDAHAGLMSALWKRDPGAAGLRGTSLEPYQEAELAAPAAKSPTIRKITAAIKTGDPVLMVMAFETRDPSLSAYRGVPVVMCNPGDGWRAPGPDTGVIFPDEAFEGWVRVPGIETLPRALPDADPQP